jgi:hypothetical protein
LLGLGKINLLTQLLFALDLKHLLGREAIKALIDLIKLRRAALHVNHLLGILFEVEVRI